ncbi:MAG: hypothetical protein JXA94_05115 [Parachlamydiales bacterium]|nr:hypothetical protein [Parachlamydiales bacterium]
MSKKILVLTILIFISFLLHSKVKYLSGEKNLSKLKDANPVSVLLTFKGTLIYDVSIDQYIKELNEEDMNAFDITRKELISDYYDEVESTIGSAGRKWNMKLVYKMSDAKKGFLIILNYDKCVPIPAVGVNGEATARIYRASNLKAPLMTIEIDVFNMISWLVVNNFHKNGRFFIKELISVLRKA